MASADVQQKSTIGFSAQTPRWTLHSLISFCYLFLIVRFQTLGLHPDLLNGVQFPNSPQLAPGTYNLAQYDDFSIENIQKRAQGPSWQQALYTEQMAKIPHSSYKQTYEKQKEDQRKLGPGTYSLNDFLTDHDNRPQCRRGVLDQLTPRFPVELKVKLTRDELTQKTMLNLGSSTTTRCLRYSRWKISR